MPYIRRDSAGSILSVSREAEAGNEMLAADDPELLGFLAGLDEGRSDLRHTDLDFVRVLEDLVELLVSKGVILFTELPESAQEKMILRQQLRSRMAGALDLIGRD